MYPLAAMYVRKRQNKQKEWQHATKPYKEKKKEKKTIQTSKI
jgi:hypothetical protein